MRAMIPLALSVAAVVWATAAQEAETNSVPAAVIPDEEANANATPAAVAVNEAANTNAVPAVPASAPPGKSLKPKALSPEVQAEYGKLTQREQELNAQIKLLNELADEHTQRATEAKFGWPEKARWETDQGQELRNRASELLRQLNELTKQRLAFQAAHAQVGPGAPTAPDEIQTLNADQLTYLTTLDERLLRVRQELVDVDAAAKSYYAELQTNNTPEAIERISFLLDENARRARQWEWEESELQLRKLEFRALRK